MINTENFRNKKVLVVGFARSGLACANLLYDLGAQVSVTDNKDTDYQRSNAAKLKSGAIKLELGRHSEDFIRGKDLVVISPGVPNESLPIVWAKKQNIPVMSEIEFSWMLCPGTVIAVTGSNGKTTVTTLIGLILKKAGRQVFVCGNIGNPFSGEVSKIGKDDFVSLEVSSFQLENIHQFKPKVAVLLNFSKNHLDRYKNMDEYLQAKKRIFMNQDSSDCLVINHDDLVLRNLAVQAKAKVIYFSKDKALNPNQLALLAVASALGIEEKSVMEVLHDFKGIEHRQEFVAEIKGVSFVNDSKATTVESAMWALESIACPIILIAGGRDKGIDYTIIRGLAKKKVKEVLLIGEAREKIKAAFRGYLPVDEACSLDEAVKSAFAKAKPGDCVLLSPMCASFDMFSDYEDRGRCFKKAVHGLMSNDKIQMTNEIQNSNDKCKNKNFVI
jgi:UDP-N-acetylmuramoylalanine--D-glutamate ligase